MIAETVRSRVHSWTDLYLFASPSRKDSSSADSRRFLGGLSAPFSSCAQTTFPAPGSTIGSQWGEGQLRVRAQGWAELHVGGGWFPDHLWEFFTYSWAATSSEIAVSSSINACSAAASS